MNPNRKIKRLLTLLALVVIVSPLHADDGMWLLALLKKYNADQLKRMGLRIPVEAISGNEGSLSEAVVAFGSGCTGSIISPEGLILTNYHCSYTAIQQLDNPALDIAGKGYWAKNRGEELPVSGLSITINKKILDISEEVKRIYKTDSSAGIKAAIEKLAQKYQQANPGLKAITKSYKNNSIVVLFLQQQYHDVRLVGLAPKNVAKFGGETDNWMWPRQSADFAFFRVYADKKGLPEAHNPSNVPLAIKNYLHISTDGYQKGDFAMSMGYPVISDRSATSAQIWEKINVLNPPLIAVRKQRQSILEEEMASSVMNRLIYAEKYATSTNYYKNAVGMNAWVNKLNIIQKKKAFELNWLNWASNNSHTEEYKEVLENIKKGIEDNVQYKRALTYSSECFTNSCDLLQYIAAFCNTYRNFGVEVKKRPSLRTNLLHDLSIYYKGFNPVVDNRITKAMMCLVFDSVHATLLPDIYQKKQLHSKEEINHYVDEVFATSLFADSSRLKIWLKNPVENIEEDPAFQLSASIRANLMELLHLTGSYGSKVIKNVTLYQASLADYNANLYYPDADKTIRLSCGTVSDLQVDDKVIPYQTSLSSLIAKAGTTNKDYQLNPVLAATWKNRDFGNYGVNNDMPVCFVTNGDVTGGNSGSPMLNADGKIIGLVFDCNWESMTREFNYEKDLHRVICADIRYLLLITEKFSGSTRITEEIRKANPRSI